MINPIAYLGDALAKGVLVPFVGAGLSASAADLPSWPGLLDRGMDYAGTRLRVSSRDPRLSEMVKTRDEGDLIGAFDQLKSLLNDPSVSPDSVGFEALIAEVFGAPQVRDASLLDAISYLNPSRVVTTNYDTLLEAHGIAGGAGISWEDSATARDAFRVGTGTLHLHGLWDRPSSLILTKQSYSDIAASKPAKQVGQLIFHGQVLLFLATSLDGTHDPHLHDLLAEFEELSNPVRGTEAPHVMLLRGVISGEERARLNRQGIAAVSYGNDYGDLPRFVRSLGDSRTVSLNTSTYANVLSAVSRAASLDDSLRAVGSWIADSVFGGRQVRVAYSEKTPAGSAWELRRRAVVPSSSSGNPHHYPLSISSWSLVEGRPLQWPGDKARRADFGWLRRMHKFDEVSGLVESADADNVPELVEFVNLATVRQRFREETLILADFFQDWVSYQPSPSYTQFLTIPVPWVENVSTRETPPEYGVYNIDTLEGAPLLNRRVRELLRLASEATVVAYRIHETSL